MTGITLIAIIITNTLFLFLFLSSIRRFEGYYYYKRSREYYNAKKLQEEYEKKYDRSGWEHTPKKDNIYYNIHFIFSIFLLINCIISYINNYYMAYLSLIGLEFTIFIILILYNGPHFSYKILFVPVFALITYVITMILLSPKILNIDYLTDLIASIINMSFTFIIFLWEMKKEKSIELSLKVIKKVPIDYDNSVIVFECQNGKSYSISTDLDEKFENGQSYKVKLNNENISSKSVKIQDRDVYMIEKIDASCFELL